MEGGWFIYENELCFYPVDGERTSHFVTLCMQRARSYSSIGAGSPWSQPFCAGPSVLNVQGALHCPLPFGLAYVHTICHQASLSVRSLSRIEDIYHLTEDF